MVKNYKPTEPFYFPGSNTGCLLIHGFTGSPSEMLYLGQGLNEAGYTVNGVLLKGHCTKPADLAETGWRDWYSSAETGLTRLRKNCSEVYIIGLSMGGLLTLYLSMYHQVKGIVSINAPIHFADRKVYLAPLLKHFKQYSKKEAVSPDSERFAYDTVSLKALTSLLEFVNVVKGELPNITSPTMVMQVKDDQVVEPKSAPYIFNSIGSVQKKLSWLDTGGHVVTAGEQRGKVLQEILDFMANGNNKLK